MPPSPHRVNEEIEAEALRDERSGFDISWPQAIAMASFALAIAATEVARYATYADRITAKMEAAKVEAELNGLINPPAPIDD
jgi:hypothetical protein